jgi:hypothetical protein
MYDPETNARMQLGLSPTKPKAQKVRMRISWAKTMLTVFFDAVGIIHREFLPEKQTVNGKFYKEVIKRLITRVHHLRPKLQESGS